MPTKQTNEGRLDFRLSRQLKEIIERAAHLSGQTLTEFAVSTLLAEARRATENDATSRLSSRDRELFVKLLDADGAPNGALVQAVRRSRKKA